MTGSKRKPSNCAKSEKLPTIHGRKAKVGRSDEAYARSVIGNDYGKRPQPTAGSFN